VRSRLLPRRRYILFAATTVAVSATAALLALLAVDVYLHNKYERMASVNIWGYRGPTVGNKRPDETRVVVLGGSSAFGYGPQWDGAFPYLLEQRLRDAGHGSYSVVNLAYNNESAYSFRYTLEDYEYLDFDIAILYEGYNDLSEIRQYQVFRRQSAIFRLTGYLPIAPMILREKAYVMLYGDISQGYKKQLQGDLQTTFRPGLATKVTGNALAAAAATVASLERQLGRLTKDPAAALSVTPTDGCSYRWSHYCGAMFDAITWARRHDKGVLVGTQPYVSDAHIDQQNALMGLLEQRFGQDVLVRHVNLGRAINMGDQTIAYDGMHLAVAGNQIIADGFVQPVLEMTRQLAAR